MCVMYLDLFIFSVNGYMFGILHQTGRHAMCCEPARRGEAKFLRVDEAKGGVWRRVDPKKA
jgi:hypothetical protein